MWLPLQREGRSFRGFCYRSAPMGATATASHVGERPLPPHAGEGPPFPRCRHKGPLLAAAQLALVVLLRALERLETTEEQRISMSRMTGTTAVTAGLGMLVFLNAVLSWGTPRTQPQALQDIPRPSAATLDPAVALQLRLGAWRHWPAANDPVAASAASSPRQPPSPTLAAQPNVPVASLVEPSRAPDRGVPVEQLPPSVPPPPQQGAEAQPPSAASPPGSPATVARPQAGKDRMLLAGPVAEPAASVQREQVGPRPHVLAPQSDPPQAEPPGNVGALPASKFGPDNFRRIERNGF